ncbi:MAG: pyruvate dehydrogenase complex E1 component subunit beta [Myxococcales bacterium]|nr:pyruvate dehydrogenase complex E1 component subunit beta [Myxococcales bacterium]
MRELALRDALNEALAEEMERDPKVFLMGEEVGEYDGAYKVSRGLLARFGPKRIIDAPISEAGFAGLGVGAAMAGLRPVIEFMTFNFAVLALDQIMNHAAKMLYMSAGQYSVPIVFRGPNGAAHMLGAQHSQAFETYYAHCPGLKVISTADPADAKGLLKSAIRDNNPVIFLESELAYSRIGLVPDGEYLIEIGKAAVKREGTDVTLVSWNKMIFTALEAAETLATMGVNAEVIDVRTIRPLDEETIIRSVQKTGRLVVVQEGWPFAGVAAEIMTRVYTQAFDWLDAPIERVTNEDVPMPYAENLEEAVLPNPEKIIRAVLRVCYLV